MDIVVALDGSKHRDLKLSVGDEVTLDVIVYAQGEDAQPIDPMRITNVRMSTIGPYSGTFPIGTLFTVSSDAWPYNGYRLVADIDGLRTTLAYGKVYVFGGPYFNSRISGNDYGWYWPYYGYAGLAWR